MGTFDTAHIPKCPLYSDLFETVLLLVFTQHTFSKVLYVVTLLE